MAPPAPPTSPTRPPSAQAAHRGASVGTRVPLPSGEPTAARQLDWLQPALTMWLAPENPCGAQMGDGRPRSAP